MRKILAALWLALLLLALCACGEKPKADFDLAVGTDLHYISPRLTDNGPYFQRVLANGDGKLAQYSEEITDAFLAQVLEGRPEALILTGDLTFNGAIESHEDLAAKLRALEAAGVPVLVLTGNHDVFNGNAARYEGEGYEPVYSASSMGFREIYGEFGPDEAISEAPDSLSYMAQLNETTRVLMLDFNSLESPCGISQDSLDWAQQQLRQAKKDGQYVLAAGHQNLYRHSMFDAGYVIMRTEQLQELLRREGVELYLSGHMHIQHIIGQKGLTEIATSALCLSPCQYGILRAEGGSVHYETSPVDVSAWAREKGSGDENLLRFADFAAESFDRRSLDQAAAALEGTDFGPEEREKMIAYAAAVQRGVFSGDLTGAEALDPEGEAAALWAQVGNLHGCYLSTVAPEIGKNFNIWDS